MWDSNPVIIIIIGDMNQRPGRVAGARGCMYEMERYVQGVMRITPVHP
jgi:hypothetical protein